MHKFLLLFVVLFAMFTACSDSGSSTSAAASKLNGTWLLSGGSMNGGTIFISTNSNKLTFSGMDFTGSFTGDSFSGDNHQNYGGSDLTNTLNISLTGDNSISGSLKVTLSVAGHTSTNTDHFTGTRK